MEIESYLKTIQEENPEFIKLTSLTTTYEGRKVYLLEIYPPAASDNNNTRAVFIDAGKILKFKNVRKLGVVLLLTI